eukprot:GHVS01071636.1.p1 GENE.GHVS01071636.1~~GHVS01071636.1.p1  ORF type:complete len:421 (+),score=39.85 GHVS01071636.1:191-1453(+)
MKMRGMLLLCVSAVLAFCCQICHSQTPEDNVRQTTRVVWLVPSGVAFHASGTNRKVEVPSDFIEPLNSSLTLEIVKRPQRLGPGRKRETLRKSMAMVVDESVYPTKRTSHGRRQRDVNLYTGFSGEFKMNDQIVTAVVYRKEPLELTAKTTRLIPTKIEKKPGCTYRVGFNWAIPPHYTGNQFSWKREVKEFDYSVGKFSRLTFHVEQPGTETPDETEPLDGDLFEKCEVQAKLMDKDVYDWLQMGSEFCSLYAEVHCYGDKPNRFVIAKRCVGQTGGLCGLYQSVRLAAEVEGDLPDITRKRKQSKGPGDDDKTPKKKPRGETGRTQKNGKGEEPAYLDNLKGLSTSDGYILLTFTIDKFQISFEPVGVIVQKREATKYGILVAHSHLKDIPSIKGCNAFATETHFNGLISLPPLAEGA